MKAQSKKPRDYQIKGYRDINQAFKLYKRVLAVGPTGMGKTVLGVMVAKKRKRCLWLAHRVELIDQAVKALIDAGVRESDIGILHGGEKKNENARFLVASVQMFRNREVPKDFDLIVVDEAHHVEAESYQAIIYALPNTPVLGLTATPMRLDGKPLGDTFEEMIVVAQPPELIASGHIMQPKLYCVPKEKARGLVKGLHSGSGDWSASQLERVITNRLLTGNVIDEWLKRGKESSTIVYAISVKHGKDLLKRFKRVTTAEYLDSHTLATEREGMIARLTSGETKVIVNITVLTEGVDIPPVKCIVLSRPTKSLALYLQMCGRGSRPHGKKRPIILDQAGNGWRFGLPETPRDWSLTGRVKGHGGEAPVKVCESCEALIPVSCKVCPECGAEQPQSADERAELEVEMQRLKATDAERKLFVQRLEAFAAERNIPKSWCEKIMKKWESERACATSR